MDDLPISPDEPLCLTCGTRHGGKPIFMCFIPQFQMGTCRCGTTGALAEARHYLRDS